MQKSYFDITSIIVTVFTIIIYPLLPTLAHGQQEQQLFPFSYTTTKNQISNDIHSGPTTSHAFSSHDKNAENSDANANDNDNVEVDDNNNDNTNTNTNDDDSVNDDNVDVNNPSSYSTSTSSKNNIYKAIILNFYDNDIGQFTNAKPILDKYGFKGTFFIVCNWASSDNPDRMTWTQITQLYREGHDRF
jgi:hypothetical protein